MCMGYATLSNRYDSNFKAGWNIVTRKPRFLGVGASNALFQSKPISQILDTRENVLGLNRVLTHYEEIVTSLEVTP